MLSDGYSNEWTTDSEAALAAFLDGRERLLFYIDGAAACFADALEHDPAFAMAHALKSVTDAQTGDFRGANISMARAFRHRRRATPRERDAIALGWSFRLGFGARVLPSALEHLKRWPTCIETLAHVDGFLFWEGGPGKARRVHELYRDVEGRFPEEDAWYMARRAFAAQEAGHFDESERLAESAHKHRRDAAVPVHTLCHVLHATGRFERIVSLLDGWLDDYRGWQSAHIAWHRALAELELGRWSAAEAAFETQVVPAAAKAGSHLQLADLVGFLWRQLLFGGRLHHASWATAAACGQRVLRARSAPADTGRQLFGQLAARLFGLRATLPASVSATLGAALATPPSLPIATVHAGIALLVTSERRQRAEVIARATALTGEPESAAVVERLLQACGSFLDGDASGAYAALEALTTRDIEHVGGSGAERSLFEAMRAEAFVRAGGQAPGGALDIAEMAWLPAPRKHLLAARLHAARGERDEARAEANAAKSDWLARGVDDDAPELAQLEHVLSGRTTAAQSEAQT
jgi:hypothetical protein